MSFSLYLLPPQFPSLLRSPVKTTRKSTKYHTVPPPLPRLPMADHSHPQAPSGVPNVPKTPVPSATTHPNTMAPSKPAAARHTFHPGSGHSAPSSLYPPPLSPSMGLRSLVHTAQPVSARRGDRFCRRYATHALTSVSEASSHAVWRRVAYHPPAVHHTALCTYPPPPSL